MTPPDPSQLPLRDIHLPPAISAWPPAPGWWVLAALVVGVPLTLWLLHAWRRRQRLRREALRDFATMAASATSPRALAAGLDLLLRRIALGLEPRQPPAAGEAWLGQIRRIAPTLQLDEEIRRVLLEAPYDPRVEFDLARTRRLVEQTLRRLPRRALPARHV